MVSAASESEPWQLSESERGNRPLWSNEETETGTEEGVTPEGQGAGGLVGPPSHTHPVSALWQALCQVPGTPRTWDLSLGGEDSV